MGAGKLLCLVRRGAGKKFVWLGRRCLRSCSVPRGWVRHVQIERETWQVQHGHLYHLRYHMATVLWRLVLCTGSSGSQRCRHSADVDVLCGEYVSSFIAHTVYWIDAWCGLP